MFYLGVERRGEPRRLLYQSIEFVVGNDEQKLLKGTVTNISPSGLGIYSFSPLKVGDELTVKSVIPTQHQIYTVRWVNELLDDFFMVGLRYKAQDDELNH
ncbi:MAG: PilZ domain-containing protein [Nitrospirae bacterium]|nr:PilZ domain-containing protein [Nitrospirota bacterium]